MMHLLIQFNTYPNTSNSNFHLSIYSHPVIVKLNSLRETNPRLAELTAKQVSRRVVMRQDKTVKSAVEISEM